MYDVEPREVLSRKPDAEPEEAAEPASDDALVAAGLYDAVPRTRRGRIEREDGQIVAALREPRCQLICEVANAPV